MKQSNRSIVKKLFKKVLLFTENRYRKITDSYTKAEVNNLLNGKSNTGHSHNDLYYTESEMNTKLSEKSNTGHNHNTSYYTKTNSDKKYTTVSEVNNVINKINTDISVIFNEMGRLSGKDYLYESIIPISKR